MSWGDADVSKAIRVKLPPTFSTHTMYAITGAMLEPDTGCKHGLVVLDFAALARIRVGGVAILCNLIEATHKANGLVHLENFEKCPAADYLRGAGFMALYGDEPHQARVSGTPYLPVRKVEYAASHSYISGRLIPWMASILGVEERSLGTIQGCIGEIFNNIRDHSSVELGCCCGVYDEDEGTITICVSDFGVGIPHNVRGYQGPEKSGSDEDAIAKACQQGFSTHTTPGNMGVGLYYLMERVCGKYQSKVDIYSGRGIILGSHNPSSRTKIRLLRKPAMGFYPGTLFYITLNVRKFVPDPVEEPFAWEQSDF